MKASKNIKVSEIFGPTLQGEGKLMGQPTVFVRTGGCDYRCSWCDTLYAVDPEFNQQWLNYTPGEILQQVHKLSGNSPILITLSGGNPALQPLGELIRIGHNDGHLFALETQGSINQSWFSGLDYLTLSPKPPSSGMPFDSNQLKMCIDAAGDQTTVSLKFVVADKIDLKWCHQLANQYPHIPSFLQPCNLNVESTDQGEVINTSLERIRWLNEQIIDYKWYDVTILPQYHLLLWGNKRGV